MIKSGVFFFFFCFSEFCVDLGFEERRIFVLRWGTPEAAAETAGGGAAAVGGIISLRLRHSSRSRRSAPTAMFLQRRRLSLPNTKIPTLRRITSTPATTRSPLRRCRSRLIITTAWTRRTRIWLTDGTRAGP